MVFFTKKRIGIFFHKFAMKLNMHPHIKIQVFYSTLTMQYQTWFFKNKENMPCFFLELDLDIALNIEYLFQPNLCLCNLVINDLKRNFPSYVLPSLGFTMNLGVK